MYKHINLASKSFLKASLLVVSFLSKTRVSSRGTMSGKSSKDRNKDDILRSDKILLQLVTTRVRLLWRQKKVQCS